MSLADRHGSSRGRTGFTLIEVLVVVAIIALLISVLIPSLHKAREQAKVMVCKTRLGQLYRGHAFYAADDKQGQFPHWSWWLFDGVGHGEAKVNYNAAADVYAKTGGVRSPDSRVWVTYGDIFRYLRDPEVYFCPGDTKVRPQSSSIGNGRGSNGQHPIHSFVRVVDPNFFIQKKIDGADVNNGQLQPGDFINPDKLRPGVFKGDSEGLPQVKNFQSIPCRVGMMYEEDQGLGDLAITRSATLNDGHSSVVVYTDYMSARHQRRGHMLFFDGHAELCETDRWNNYSKDKYVLYRVLGAGNYIPPKP
ncbi:MAG TPA: type II secretion system protein [Phycisphaerae bacterium]|nr:type II secretion system protein [Phycisphaerae bacterium]HRY66430.1 type II secretion system protein [Phycisphaerae bacterium]HSA25862.1 type II secretion system protein [Phycisphaerae bacterium]